MSYPTTARRGRPVPQEIALTAEKDTRVGLTLMRPSEEITLGPDKRFVVVPGPRGNGWVLQVYDAPDENA